MSGIRHRLRPAVTAFLQRLAPRTLRGQLSLVAVTTAALLMLVLTVAFNAVAQHRLQHQADDELRTRAAAVATTIDTSRRTVRVLETSNDALLDTNVWIYAGRRLLEEPPNAGSLTHVADALAERGGRRCVTADVDGPLRLCSQPVPADKSGALVVTALDLSPYRSSADTLLLGSLALDAVMLACTYALTRLAVGRALRPVRTMTDQATQWSAVASEERFGACAAPGRTRAPRYVVGRHTGPHPHTPAPRAAAHRGTLARAAYAPEPDHRRTRLVADPPPHRRPDPRHPQGHRGRRPVHAHHLRHPPRRRPRRRHPPLRAPPRSSPRCDDSPNS